MLPMLSSGGGAGGGLPSSASNTDVSDADNDTPDAVADENGAQGIERNDEVVEPVPVLLKIGGKAVHPCRRSLAAATHPLAVSGRLCTL